MPVEAGRNEIRLVLRIFHILLQNNGWEKPDVAFVEKMPHLYTPQGQHRLAVFMFALGDRYGFTDDRAGELGGRDLLDTGMMIPIFDELCTKCFSCGWSFVEQEVVRFETREKAMKRLTARRRNLQHLFPFLISLFPPALEMLRKVVQCWHESFPVLPQGSMPSCTIASASKKLTRPDCHSTMPRQQRT